MYHLQKFRKKRNNQKKGMCVEGVDYCGIILYRKRNTCYERRLLWSLLPVALQKVWTLEENYSLTNEYIALLFLLNFLLHWFI